jgi:hypothetical protein
MPDDRTPAERRRGQFDTTRQGLAGTPDRASDFDESMADVPVLGWLFGSGGRRDAARAEAQQKRAEGSWNALMSSAPGADELSVEYDQLGTGDEYGDLLGGRSQIGTDQQLATTRDALQRVIDGGGYTAADRNAQNAAMAQNAQQVGAMNQAALRSQYARGMGGSGAELATQLSGSQALASANQQNQAALQQAAMQRLMQGAGLQGQLSNVDLQRKQALDDYNQRQLDWRRGRSATNTGLANRTKESAAGASQQEYENRERGVAGVTGQYQAGNQSAAQRGNRQDQNNQQQAGFWGSLLSGMFG